MSTFSNSLINWYEENKRELPWRKTTDPYKIWLSEIILQQTRVDQGLAYYLKFINTYPTVENLASAPLDDVLNLWQGLGYYSRARNLHDAAQTIANDYKGEFPKSFSGLKKLKGIGDYTAAAIASFCFKQPTPVLDGNVYRVISRQKAISLPINTPAAKKEFTNNLLQLIDYKKPDQFNQAIMELGALICKPTNPTCSACPINSTCMALATGTINQYPVKGKKKNVKKRYLHYLYFKGGEQLINKREKKDIWQGLFEFPLIETEEESINLKEFPILKKAIKLRQYKHILTHQHLFTTFWELPKDDKIEEEFKTGFWVESKNLVNFAFPRVITRFLEDLHQPTLDL